MWIVIFNALDDFGIREVNDMVRTGSPGNEHPNYGQIESIMKKVSDDALHGALRIAGLVSVPVPLSSIRNSDSWRVGWCLDHQWLSGAWLSAKLAHVHVHLSIKPFLRSASTAQ